MAATGGADAEPGNAEDLLISELGALGARSDVVPRERPDGVRGLFATRDLDAEEQACWVPNASVLEHSSCDPGLRDAIRATLAEAKVPEAESRVYASMIALAGGYLLEKARGTSSKFHRYIEALPPYPPTVNTFTPAEREAFTLLSAGKDPFGTYSGLIDQTAASLERAAGLWGDTPVPSREDVEAAFFFVLSRMSYMRLIPLCDLANAALPGEENARIVVEGQIVDGREGCALVTKRPVKAGQEVVIDYNHHDAIGMLTNYGCTLGLEEVRSATRFEVGTPPFLRDMVGPSMSQASQLCEDEPDVLQEKVLGLLRMASLNSREELLAAAQAGYFGDGASAIPPERRRRWDELQGRMYFTVSKICIQKLQELEETVGPALKGLDETRLAGRVALRQYETDKRLLDKCRKVMLGKAEALLKGRSGEGT